MKRRGLGKGLNALLAGTEARQLIQQDPAVDMDAPQVALVSTQLIQSSPFQPRRHFSETDLEELAESIRRQGVLQPIILRPLADGHYELVAGERRWRAAQRVGLADIPALVRTLDDHQVAAIALIENVQRADLNPLEEMQALERLQQDFGMTHQEIAEAIGRSRTAVTNLLRLRDLDSQVKDCLHQGQIDMGHARALLALEHGQQRLACQEIIRRKLSVRATEALVQSWQKGSQAKTAKRPAPAPPEPLRSLAQRLSQQLGGAQVEIKQRARGQGALEIRYRNAQELERLIQCLDNDTTDVNPGETVLSSHD